MTLAALHGPFTVIAAIVFCKEVTKHEIGATFIIIGAAFLIILDPDAKRVDSNEPNIVADLVSLSGSIPLALFFKFTDMLKPYMPMYQIVYW